MYGSLEHVASSNGTHTHRIREKPFHFTPRPTLTHHTLCYKKPDMESLLGIGEARKMGKSGQQYSL